ncbi:MAG: hypothetical protein ABIY51_06055 [Ferruginibacter sp.]
MTTNKAIHLALTTLNFGAFTFFIYFQDPDGFRVEANNVAQK